MDWFLGTGAFYILARRIFLLNILADSAALEKRWPVDASEMLTMYLIAEYLVKGWEVIKDEFKKTKTLADKRLRIAMMYQPWELCDDTFTEWSAANKITLPAKDTFAQCLPSTCTLTEYDSCVIYHKLCTQTFHTLSTTHAKKRIVQWNSCEQGICVSQF